jgi:hypothetical protein
MFPPSVQSSIDQAIAEAKQQALDPGNVGWWMVAIMVGVAMIAFRPGR